MLRKVIALAGGAAMVAGLGLAGAGAAAASPRAVPANVVGSLGDTNGTAGWYTNTFAGTYNKNTATFTLPATGFGAHSDDTAAGGLGAQLCNSNDANAVEVGAIPTQLATDGQVELYTVGIGWGDLTSSINGSTDPVADEDSCPGNGFFDNGGPFTGLANDVPVGDQVQVRLQVVKHEYATGNGPAGVWFYSEDTRGIANFSKFESFEDLTYGDGQHVEGPFNEAAAGISADQNEFSGPDVNALTAFSNATACQDGGGCHGYAYWNAVSVSSSADGIAPWLIAPALISPSVAACVWHPGHREYFGPKGHRTGYKWLKGYQTCTGGGSSSFTIDTGTEVGL